MEKLLLKMVLLSLQISPTLCAFFFLLYDKGVCVLSTSYISIDVVKRLITFVYGECIATMGATSSLRFDEREEVYTFSLDL